MRSKILNEMIEHCGHQAALAVVRQYGGRQLSIPTETTLTENHPLALVVGLTNARRMAQLRGGERIEIPVEMNVIVELRNEAIVAAFDDSQSIRRIALDFQISRKWVRNILDRCGRGEELAAREALRNQSHLPEAVDQE